MKKSIPVKQSALFVFKAFIVWKAAVFFLAFLFGGNWPAIRLLPELAFFLFLFLFFHLAKQNQSEKIAKLAVIFFLLFPTSFLERSLADNFYLGLTAGIFLLLHNQSRKAKIIGFLAGLSCLLSPLGFFLVPALIIGFFLSTKSFLSGSKQKAFLFFLITGFLVALFFFPESFSRSFEQLRRLVLGTAGGVYKLILPYQLFWRYFKMFFAIRPVSAVYFRAFLEFFSGVFLFSATIAYLIKKNFHIAAYLAFVLGLPIFSGTFVLLPELTPFLFPAFIPLASLARKKRLFFGLYVMMAVFLLIFNFWFLR